MDYDGTASDGTAYNCARALWTNQYADFALGGAGGVDLAAEGWAKDVAHDPAHLTIVPFVGPPGCDDVSSAFEPDGSSNLALFLTSTAGIRFDGCDVSDNAAQQCVNEPRWMMDDGAEAASMTLYGTLFGALDRQRAAGAGELAVHVPEAYDVVVGVNTVAVRFYIDEASADACRAFVADPTDAAAAAGCTVTSAEALMISGPADVALSVTGLGRIGGYFTTGNLFQKYNMKDVDGIYGYFQPNPTNVAGIGWGVGVNQWSDLAVNVINAHMLAIASQYPANCPSGDFSPYVQGLQVAWAGRLGHSAIALNSAFAGTEMAYDNNLGPQSTTEAYCAGLYDVKSVGNWPDRADGIDVMGSRSAVTSFYVQANDDAIKVAVDRLIFKDTTVLQGFAGGAINVGSYGFMRSTGIQGSSVTNTWIHRSLQYGNPAGGSKWPGADGGDCAGSTLDGSGGLVMSRTCPFPGLGLQDFTIDTLEVPEIGTVNRVGRVFALGANPQGGFCGGDCGGNDASVCCGSPAGSASYPIKNLIFKGFTIYSQPQVSTCGRRAGSGGLTDSEKCLSSLTDVKGCVQWGDRAGAKSMTFYDPSRSDPAKCDFKAAVTLGDQGYFTCAYPWPSAPAAGQPHACWGGAEWNGKSTMRYIDEHFFDTGSSQFEQAHTEFPTCSVGR